MYYRKLSPLLAVTFLLALPLEARPNEPAACAYLGGVMDRFNKSFDVFTDLGAAGNHFAARAAMVRNSNNPAEIAAVAYNEAWTENPRSGATCIRCVFLPVDSTYWGGWYFQNGVLLTGDTMPRPNWGDYPDAGFDLTGATKVTFWARGELGGEKIEFFAGGVGMDAALGTPTTPYPDSFARVPHLGHVTTLTKKWRKYTINLRRLDLSYVNGGFAWVANAPNNPHGATFYLDDVQYNRARPDELRFLVSYDTLPAPHGDNFDTILKNVAYTYDNAVALLAYLARARKDDLRRAAMLADAFVYAQNHDRYYGDGRLRNAYQGGDLILPPGWTPNDRSGTARMPGWWDAAREHWFEDAGHVGTSTGNVAWAMIALLRAHQVLGGTRYLDAAERLGLWIENNTRDERGHGGYTGGFEGWEPDPTKLLWKSTEHNIDTYVAFMTLSDLLPEPDKTAWQERAIRAKEFVRSMWQACGPDHFATGTTEDGVTPNADLAPADVNAWALMALGELPTYGPAVKWVEANCQVSEPLLRKKSVTGFDFNDDGDGIWWEGTAHMAIAENIAGEHAKAAACLKNLRLAQRFAPNTNRKGVVAACRDGVTTGIAGFVLYNRLHVGATAWYALSERRDNPFWGAKTSDPIPHEGQ